MWSWEDSSGCTTHTKYGVFLSQEEDAYQSLLATRACRAKNKVTRSNQY